jgi:DNA-binding NtrC family response regulator
MNTARTVLIVDDEPHVRMVFQIALESAGYTVFAAGGGEEALNRLRAASVDLVLLDLKMPVLDGMETLRRLRAQGNLVPVVIITAHGSVADAVAAMKQGAVDFVPKPVSPTTLREVVARVLTEPPAQPQKPAPERPGPQPDLLCIEDLARARRALERADFDDAEFFLRVAEALDPGSTEVPRIRSELKARRSAPGAMRFRVVGEWSS